MITILFAGVTYNIPETGEEGWGEDLTSYLVAIPGGVLQRSGGSFTLTGDVNFGSTFGLLAKYFETRTALPSTAGLVRLAKTDSMGWRDNANGSNLLLAIDGSDRLTFNGVVMQGAFTIGALDAAAANAAGLDLTGTVLSAQSADATHPGMVNITTQTFAGQKTFSTGVTGTLTGTASGNTTYSANQYGVVLSGSANAMAVLAPDASTAKVLVSGGASANPVWSTLTNTNLSGSAAISNANLATMASASSTVGTVKGNISGSSATPSDVVLTSANTVSSVVYRDSSGNFSAGTITAALTGAASGNLSATANQYGVLLSGAANVAVVLAPDASTVKVLVSGGTSANPAWSTLTNSNLSGSAAISNANLATMVTATVKGNISGSTATPSDVSLVAAATASTVMLRDTNVNSRLNNLIENFATTATGATTTTLVVGSARVQQFTGSTTQNCVLPDATTLVVGQSFIILNRSSGVVTVKDGGGSTVQAMASASQTIVTVTAIGSTAGTWDNAYTNVGSGSSPGTVTSVTFTGDGVVLSSTPSSAVTAAGTVTAALKTQTATLILAGPTNGSAATPTFRALNAVDIPVGALGAADANNIGLSTSVGSSALTINLKINDASTDPSASSPCTIAFRSATATTGSNTLVSATAATSIVVPSGATLGQTSGVNQYVWVYALNNAGTIELAVSGVKLFDDYSIQSSTTIGAGSTSGTTLYSTTGRSNVGIRLIGRLLVSEVTAGTWNTAVAEVSLVSGKQSPTVTDWNSTYTFTPNNFGTVTNSTFYSRRNGPNLEVLGQFTMGTGSGSAASISLPLSINTAILGALTNAAPFGTFYAQVPGGSAGIGTGNNFGPLFYDTSDATKLFFAVNVASGQLTKTNGSLYGAGGVFSIQNLVIPIAGWSTYGP